MTYLGAEEIDHCAGESGSCDVYVSGMCAPAMHNTAQLGVVATVAVIAFVQDRHGRRIESRKINEGRLVRVTYLNRAMRE